MKALVLLLPPPDATLAAAGVDSDASGRAATDRLAAWSARFPVGLSGRVRGADGSRGDGARLLVALAGADPLRERPGRGALVAAGLGCDLGEGDLALCLSLLTSDGRRSPLVPGEERLLVQALAHELGREGLALVAGRAGCHLLAVTGGADLALQTSPPWCGPHPQAATGADDARLGALEQAAGEVLSCHDVNRVRRDLGELTVDRCRAWGPGGRLVLEPFRLRTGRRLVTIGGDPALAGLATLLDGEAQVLVDAGAAAWSRAVTAACAAADLVIAQLPQGAGPDEVELPVVADHDGGLRIVATADQALAADGTSAWIAWGSGLTAESRSDGARLVEPAHALIDYVVSARHDEPGDRTETL